MSTTETVRVGDRGRMVIPSPLRGRQHWEEGTVLHLIETPAGVVMASRDQLKALVRAQLAGGDLVEELITQRRVEASRQNQS
ncbi:AbrB/MazE/SpoVT family DNA-binding domain-containing protein [Brachybacterium sp. JHP9]|uniref:AbrB/MazE/SpoVT family DNA-binding domain-containing protein n=1 Tax=Brachybacterium equifaecis TaxID=2910770 RepID=A0ABT0QWC5_9MICO|nr:AbrB/MazE/SpoVT family DNA-binding domain-containing protein [Brachybacterium equifaecis]MCL6421967.1 AbrB/MazE/SpoVT family DNA-binding domain-containing protein [Brachybacterium equifaecis]